MKMNLVFRVLAICVVLPSFAFGHDIRRIGPFDCGPLLEMRRESRQSLKQFFSNIWAERRVEKAYQALISLQNHQSANLAVFEMHQYLRSQGQESRLVSRIFNGGFINSLEILPSDQSPFGILAKILEGSNVRIPVIHRPELEIHSHYDAEFASDGAVPNFDHSLIGVSKDFILKNRGNIQVTLLHELYHAAMHVERVIDRDNAKWPVDIRFAPSKKLRDLIRREKRAPEVVQRYFQTSEQFSPEESGAYAFQGLVELSFAERAIGDGDLVAAFEWLGNSAISFESAYQFATYSKTYIKEAMNLYGHPGIAGIDSSHLPAMVPSSNFGGYEYIAKIFKGYFAFTEKEILTAQVPLVERELKNIRTALPHLESALERLRPARDILGEREFSLLSGLIGALGFFLASDH